ncbi:MAG: type II secretion system F family protein [Dehalococcoidia bacterium]
MTFRYVAIAPGGEQVSGAIDVASESQAERALWDANYRVVSIRAARKLPGLEQLFPSLFAVKKRALVVFSRQLATLLESGVPVMRCLELLEEQTSGSLAKAIHGIGATIRGGSPFADAIREWPNVFPPVYSRMVELGERTGRLEDMLRQVATYLEREDEVASRVRGAMAYPAFVLVLAVVVIAVLTTTALPPLVQLFDEFEGDLPITTRFLMAFTAFTSAFRMQILATIAITVLGGGWYMSRAAGKRLLDRVQVAVPVIRGITIDANAARFSRTLSVLIGAGLPLTEVMDMVVKTTENSVLRRAVEGVRQLLLDGEGLSGPMARAGCYPHMLVQMVAVGEESGTLEGNLQITAEFYAREVDRRVDGLTAMLTPALTLIVGGIVAFIALSLIMPMYQLIGNLNDATTTGPPPPPS